MPHGTAWVAVVGLLVAGLAIAGAGHAEDPEVHPLTTAEEEPIPAQVPLTLGWVLTNDQGQPAFHQDARFEVSFEGETLLSTTPASGHDYDGIDPYQVAFPRPGNYTVKASVHDDGEVRELTYEGQVGPPPGQPLDVEIQAPEEVAAGHLTGIDAQVTAPGGQPVEDVEVTLRVQRSMDRFEVLKTRTDVEDGSATVRYAFERTATFDIVAVATPLPGGDADRWAPTTAEHTLAVEDGRSLSVGAPVEQPMVNDRTTGQDEEAGYELFGTYDPYTSVGPHGRLRLGMLTLDAASHAPVPDVDYRASILDPEGDLIFQASDLAGADGFEYVTLSRPDPGTYQMRVDAAREDWRDHTVLEFTVLPPAGATNAGPLFASPNASTSLEAGEATTFPVHVEDAAGVPLTHGEVDFRLVDGETGVPAAVGKLHVHENGTMPVTLAPLRGGEHRLDLLPQSLQAAPTPYTYGEGVGQPPVFTVDVTDEASLGDELDPQGDDEGSEVDALGPALFGVGLAIAAVTARRSR